MSALPGLGRVETVRSRLQRYLFQCISKGPAILPGLVNAAKAGKELNEERSPDLIYAVLIAKISATGEKPLFFILSSRTNWR